MKKQLFKAFEDGSKIRRKKIVVMKVPCRVPSCGSGRLPPFDRGMRNRQDVLRCKIIVLAVV